MQDNIHKKPPCRWVFCSLAAACQDSGVRGPGREGRPSAPACREGLGLQQWLGKDHRPAQPRRPRDSPVWPLAQWGGSCTPRLGGRGRHSVVELEMPPLPLSLALLCTFPWTG